MFKVIRRGVQYLYYAPLLLCGLIVIFCSTVLVPPKRLKPFEHFVIGLLDSMQEDRRIPISFCCVSWMAVATLILTIV